MPATLALASWCAGLALGYLAPPALPTGLELGAGAGMAVAAAVSAGRAVVDHRRGGRPAVMAPAVLAAGALLLFGLAHGTAARHTPGPATVDGYLGRTVVIDGVVDSAAVPAAGGGSPTARLQGFRVAAEHLDAADGHRVQGTVLVQGRGQAPVFPGQRVRIRGRLTAPRQVGPGGAAGYADRLERQGVFAEMPSATVRPLESAPAFSPARVVGAIRGALIYAARARLPAPEAGVVLGEVAGIRGALPAEIDADLVDSGLVHILAISGIKVAIVAGLLQALTVPAFGRRGALAAIAGVALYTLVGGATASALRSALMGSLGLLGGLLRRDTDVVRSLLLAAAAMLGHQPALVADLSFQYSFLGVLGIHLFAAPVAARLQWVPEPFREAVAVTAGAQLATIPLTAHHFHVVPLLGPVTNGLVLPTLPAAIVAGMLLAAIHAVAASAPTTAGLVDALAVPVAGLAFVLARAALVVAHLARVAPGAVLKVSGFGAAPSVAYYMVLGTLVAGRGRGAPKLLLAGAAGAAATVALIVVGRPDGHLHVTFPAGVTGPVAVVTAPDGATMVVGGGASAAALGPALDAALPASAPLPGAARRIDAVAVLGSSHDDAGGLAALTSRSVAVVLTPRGLPGGAASDAVARLGERGAHVVSLAAGDTIAWHGLTLVAYPGADTGEVSLELRAGGRSVLIAGAGGGRAPPRLPRGRFDAVAVGSGAVEPVVEGVSTSRVVVQRGADPLASSSGTSGAGVVARGLRAFAGDALWDTSRDGVLVLTCDDATCAS